MNYFANCRNVVCMDLVAKMGNVHAVGNLDSPLNLRKSYDSTAA